jgi:hypothetical protein
MTRNPSVTQRWQSAAAGRCWKPNSSAISLAVTYLVTNKQIAVRHIGARVLIQVADLRRFSRGDHPQRLAG